MDFVKMHGIGNDYIFIDTISNDIEDPSMLSVVLSDRHFGVGGDGIVLIGMSETADYSMRIFNADGSEAETCGNALRCIGKFLYDNYYIDKKIVDIQTKSGVKRLWLSVDDDNKVDSIKVDMGRPILEPGLIPTKLPKDSLFNYPLMVGNKLFRISVLSMGNPHCIVFNAKANDVVFRNFSPLIQYNNLFPEKVNVIWADVIDRSNIAVRVWERGVGETLACGSGANDGGGGGGGAVSSYDVNNTYIRRLDERTGTSGGSKGGNSGGSTSAYQTQSYTPENNRLDYGQGAGGTNPNGSGGCGGGGWFYGHNGGAGGNNGKNGSAGGIGAGGGAGAWAVFAGGSGARGGNGYAALFY